MEMVGEGDRGAQKGTLVGGQSGVKEWVWVEESMVGVDQGTGPPLKGKGLWICSKCDRKW